ncbi:phage regulatory protein, rha family [Flexibacter flexilis DSM 6793]|uniref:Phage regulatory protein, rha family n=1 Tax=Flexibacter flexilis DSM 6793 TaxID=927664 RepID=A0A1I1E1S2_9BACT|nr:Rha family transcriptional regulator [Flexibacter flexilis]SFB80622.1 phage regulatory protein, rha family [Flexibacter flexilis DSM 6793]
MPNKKESPAPTKNEQMVIANNGQPITTSRKVAQAFGKEHKIVMRDIRELGCSPEFGGYNFVPTSYLDKQGKERPEYQITKNGFVMLVMGYTGENAMAFKEAYIAAFDKMEAQLHSYFLPAEQQGKFAGLQPVVHTGVKCFCYIDVLRAVGFSTRSGSVYGRRKKFGTHFFKVFGRTFITADYANHLDATKQLMLEASKMQLDIPFQEEGGVSC